MAGLFSPPQMSSSAIVLAAAGECSDNRRETASPRLPNAELSSGQTVEVSLCLHEKKLWDSFYQAGNEMILTKKGRRMFPFIMVTPTGLKPSALYTITLRVVCADNFKYKYTNRQWHTVGTTDVTHETNRMAYQHPSTPAPGEQLNNKTIDFKSMKITHNPKSQNGNILLHTMHKYYVEVCIDETCGEDTNPHKNATERANHVFTFPETSFIGVTSYLSSELTELKVKHNPFARGFKNRPPMCADFNYPDQMNLMPTFSAANQLPIVFSPPPNPPSFPIGPLPLLPPPPHPSYYLHF